MSANESPELDDEDSKNPPTTSGDEDDEAWLPRAKTALVMDVSRTTLAARVRRGDIVSRVEQGIRLFRVNMSASAAARLIALREKARERAEAGDQEQAIVLAFVGGKSIEEIIIETKSSPNVIARTLRHFQSALEVARTIYAREREVAEEERILEIETGHPDVPTTWAWCDFLFNDPTKYTYEDAKKKFELWEKGGGAGASPHVLRALESLESWTVARRMWKAEVTREGDKKARATFEEQHRLRMLVGKQEILERGKVREERRRTAALLRPTGRKQKSTQANAGRIDERSGFEHDEPSDKEEAAT